MSAHVSSAPQVPGPLVMVDIPGTTLDADTAAFLRQHGVRAVCLFRKNLGSEAEIRALVLGLREALGPQALIAMDQEGGAVVRATCLPQGPSGMALGAVDDTGLAQAVGAATARGLKSLGINWNFAPVLDVNSNPANPVIGERAFGDTPERVARLAGAWMQGALAEGVACCVKHFPGHGDTHQDSHHALPTVDKSLAELQALELQPFAALIDAPAVMTAHIVYPQIDPELPATLSRRFLTDLLRTQMGYRGVVITDALMMQAVHRRWGPARAAVLALAAGADMVLAQGTREEQQAVLQAIQQAQATGELQPAALQASAARLDALAQAYPSTPGPYAARGADEALVHSAWAAALTALGGAQPPGRQQPLRVLTQASVASDGVSEAGVDAVALRALFAPFADVRFDTVPSLLHGLWPAADGRFTVLVSNHRSRYALGEAPRPPADLHLALWNPYQALDIAAPSLLSWGYAPGALAAVAAWLRGDAVAPGRLPIHLSGVAV